MPRYFFDLAKHEDSADDEGTELADIDAARLEAMQFTGEYLREHPDMAWDGRELRVIVRDQQARVVFTVVTLGVDGC